MTADVLWGLLLSMRPKQWTKNALVFMALVFSVDLYWQPGDFSSAFSHIGRSALAFVIFCAASGALYIVNDVIDLEQDRRHPTKRSRPLASGLVPISLGLGVACVALAAAVGASFALYWGFGLVLIGYVALTLSYSLYLKHLLILDVFAVAAGFVLRAAAGAVVIDVPISPWLYICTALGALFISIIKRRQELILLDEVAGQHRRTLEHYTPELLDQMAAVITPSTIVAYGLYTFSAEHLPDNHAMMLTVPFVLYGLFRYLYLANTRNEGGSPEEVLLRDRPLLADIILWFLAVVVILYCFRD